MQRTLTLFHGIACYLVFHATFLYLIGFTGVPLPTMPMFAVMQAHARIADIEEYERTRVRVGADTAGGSRAWRVG